MRCPLLRISPAPRLAWDSLRQRCYVAWRTLQRIEPREPRYLVVQNQVERPAAPRAESSRGHRPRPVVGLRGLQRPGGGSHTGQAYVLESAPEQGGRPPASDRPGHCRRSSVSCSGTPWGRRKAAARQRSSPERASCQRRSSRTRSWSNVACGGFSSPEAVLVPERLGPAAEAATTEKFVPVMTVTSDPVLDGTSLPGGGLTGASVIETIPERDRMTRSASAS